jgi:hypothetical protein
MRLFLLGLACLLLAGGAEAGTLVQGRLEGLPFQAELGSDSNLVLVTVGGTRRLVDLGSADVFLLDEGRARRSRAGALDNGSPLQSWRLTRWYAGPMVAGNASTYNVLTLDETICGEVLASRWMLQFLDPIVRAVDLVQRVDQRVRPKAYGTCGRIPFDVYAENGWPLMAGWKDQTVFKTDKVSFDHAIPDGLIQRPRDFADCGARAC